jgi:hypothetical protein
MIMESTKRNPIGENVDTRKGTLAVLISLILIGSVLVPFLAYQYIPTNQSEVPILEVAVEVK